MIFTRKGRIKCIIDGGATQVGLESTVIDLNSKPPLILRPGGITLSQLQKFVPDIQLYKKETDNGKLAEQPPTPGLKYRHYSPNAKVILFEHPYITEHSVSEWIQKEVEKKVLQIRQNQPEAKIAILSTHPEISYEFSHPKPLVQSLGSYQDMKTVASNLFGALRSMDDHGIAIILLEGVPEMDEGEAVMNRAIKSATEYIKWEK